KFSGGTACAGPWRCLCHRSNRRGWVRVKSSVSSSETVGEAETEIAAERREAEGVLVLLVEKVGDTASEGNVTSDEIASVKIEARVAGIVSETEAEKIAVRADAYEIAREIQ